MDRSRRPASAGRRGSATTTSPPSGDSDSSVANKEANTAATVIQCRKHVLDRWELLKQQAQARRALLEESHQFQVFKRDEKDALAWIESKTSFAKDESYRDPTNLQAKLHKQQAFEAKLAARQSEQNKLLAMGNELIDAGHYKADEIEQALLILDQKWQDLQEKTVERRQKLEEAQRLQTELQKFIGDFRDVMSWMKEMCNQMTSAELAKDLPGAEDLLKIHQELKSEIQARENVTKKIHEFGQNLVLTEHYAKDDIIKDLNVLKAQKEQMDNTWEKRKVEFQQCLELQQFERDARVAEKWTAARDTFLQALEEDLGDSLDSVEALQKKHDNFEKSLAAQEENIKALVEFADRLVSEGHYAVREIESIQDLAIENREMLKQSAEERRQMLQQSYEKQCFDRDTNEAETWIAEQMLVASDESYRDPTNLQGKIQKQEAFEAEIAANRSQVDNVVQTAIRLNDSGHFASEHITGRVERLSELWDSLCEVARVKTERLGEAWKAQQLNRAIKDVMVWIETTASSLISEEHGRDLASVNALLKRHQLIEHSISAYRERVEALRQQGQLLVEQGHFSADEINQICLTLVERYEGLAEPAATRHQLLRSSLELHQYLREIDDLEAWLIEREPLAESTEYGTDLTGAQSLHKKHQAFAAELAGHQQRILGLGSTARSLYEDGHMSSDLIMDKYCYQS
jgi:spectrin alpha